MHTFEARKASQFFGAFFIRENNSSNMRLRDHIKYSSISSLALFPLVGVGAFYFFLGSILIDLDHCIEYAVKFRSFSVRGMFVFYESLAFVREPMRYLGLSLFHTLEFLIFVLILSLFFSWLWFVWFGMVFHWILDVISLYNPGASGVRALSLIEYIVRIKHYINANREVEAQHRKGYLRTLKS